MINFKQIFDDIYVIIAKKQSFFEFLLNLTFILIISIILIILYWDSINRSIINTGRCKIAINSGDLTYNLNIYDKKENTHLFDISYDNTDDKNYKVECSCPIGDTVNKFQIPVWNNKNRQIDKLDKYCYCDKTYTQNVIDTTTNTMDKDKINMDGDAFLIDYYNGLFDSVQSGRNNYEPINFNNYAPVE